MSMVVKLKVWSDILSRNNPMMKMTKAKLDALDELHIKYPTEGAFSRSVIEFDDG